MVQSHRRLDLGNRQRNVNNCRFSVVLNLRRDDGGQKENQTKATPAPGKSGEHSLHHNPVPQMQTSLSNRNTASVLGGIDEKKMLTVWSAHGGRAFVQEVLESEQGRKEE